MTHSKRLFVLIAATWLGAGFLQAAGAPTASTYLRFLEVERNGTGEVSGLNGAAGVAVSPDGRHVYATGELEDALAVFERDSASGALTFVEEQKDVLDGSLAGGDAGLRRLNGAHGVVVSPDGAQVYVTSKTGDALTVFSRDVATGALTFVQTKYDSVGGVNGLDGAEGIAISPDGAHVYVAGRNDNALAVFARDASTGAVTFVEMDRDGVAGVTGLAGAKAVAVSPDGAHVYAAGSLDNAVAAFTRDAGSGKLTFVEAQEEGQNGVVGLTRARAVAVSPDGANVYVAGGYDDALVVFARDAATGTLTYLQLLEDSVNGINGLNGADAVAVSPDGTHVYVTASVDDALAVFARDAGSGTLTYVERLRDGIGDIDGLNRAAAVAVSNDGRNVYAAGYVDDAVAVFRVRGCGDGVLDPGEECDDGNLQDGDCCSSTCRFEPATTLCRPAAGPCDVADFCTGASGSCPDQLEPPTFECRGTLGACDRAEFCTGTDAACPADALEPSTTVCRPAAGPCDVAETCTGTGPSCPADQKSTGICRPAAGGCDVAERCDGVSDDCPADTLEPASFECRPAGGVCDLAETCTGTSAACPADQKSTAVCRPAAGDCDVAERCDGLGNDCPADTLVPATVECRPAAGPCDVAEHCSGHGPTCPADAIKSAGAECRPAVGPCDLAETCDGSTTACPADVLKPAGAPCGIDSDPCALDSSCTGASAACPTAAPKVGIAAALCAFDRNLGEGACSGQSMPPVVHRLFVQARGLVAQTNGASPARKRKLLRQAGTLLKKANAAIARAERRKQAPLSASCATLTKAMISDALGRVAAIGK